MWVDAITRGITDSQFVGSIKRRILWEISMLKAEEAIFIETLILKRPIKGLNLWWVAVIMDFTFYRLILVPDIAHEFLNQWREVRFEF